VVVVEDSLIKFVLSAGNKVLVKVNLGEEAVSSGFLSCQINMSLSLIGLGLSKVFLFLGSHRGDLSN